MEHKRSVFYIENSLSGTQITNVKLNIEVETLGIDEDIVTK